MKVDLYINGEKECEAELQGFDLGGKDRSVVTAMFDGSVVHTAAFVGTTHMSLIAFDKLIGRTGPGTRLRKARKWHMNRSERRELATERHQAWLDKFARMLSQRAAKSDAVILGAPAWTAI